MNWFKWSIWHVKRFRDSIVMWSFIFSNLRSAWMIEFLMYQEAFVIIRRNLFSKTCILLRLVLAAIPEMSGAYKKMVVLFVYTVALCLWLPIWDICQSIINLNDFFYPNFSLMDDILERNEIFRFNFTPLCSTSFTHSFGFSNKNRQFGKNVVWPFSKL